MVFWNRYFSARSSLFLLVLQCYTTSTRPCKDFIELVPKNVIGKTGVFFYFSTCGSDQTLTDADTSNCSACSGDMESQFIRDASICETHNGQCKNRALPHTDHHFSVHISTDLFEHSGQYDYNITYQYSCEPQYNNDSLSLCLQQFHLSLRVTDFNLNIISSQTRIVMSENNAIISPKEGDTVSMECSSGLTYGADIPVRFIFVAPNSNHQSVLICDPHSHDQIQRHGNWIVERRKSAPHSCLLNIMNVSQSEVGTYHCVGVLPHGVGDWSDSISIVVESKIYISQSPISKTYTSILGAIFGIAIFFIVITLLGFCLVISYSVGHRRRAPPTPTPTPAPSPVQGTMAQATTYGSLSETEPPLSKVDSQADRDEEEIVPVQEEQRAEIGGLVIYNGHAAQIEVSVEVEPSPSDTDATPQPNLLNYSHLPVHSESPQVNTATSTPKSRDIEVAQPESGNLNGTPDLGSTLARLQKAVNTPVDGTSFHGQAPDFVAEPSLDPCEKTARRLSSEDPQSSSPDSELHISEERSHSISDSSRQDQSLQFRISLTSDTEQSTSSSKKTGDDYPTHISNSSTDSEDTKAIKEYNKQVHLPPLMSKTPESQLPDDPKYTCPYCKKCYAGDQRQYFTNHMKECQESATASI